MTGWEALIVLAVWLLVAAMTAPTRNPNLPRSFVIGGDEPREEDWALAAQRRHPLRRRQWRQAEPYRDDTAMTLRELIPAVLVWFGLLFVCLWILPLLFAVPTP